MTFLESDFYESTSQKSQMNETLRWMLITLNGTIFCGWIIGAIGFSMAWLVLLMALVAAVWSPNLMRAIEEVKNEEVMKVRRRKALWKDETAEWLNFLFNRWWALSSRSIFQLLRERFEPLLNDAKPAFVESVELRQFTFGDRTPCVKSVRTYDVIDGKRTPYNERNSVFANPSQCRIALVIDLYLNSEEFALVLRTRLFGKEVGIDLDIAMEKLNVSGKLEVLLTMDADSLFPHVKDISVMFIEKPTIWFSIRMLKSIQMMEVPILKTWIHSVFMDAFETAIVDPARLRLNLTGNKGTPGANNNWVSSAQGVLTVIASDLQSGNGNGDSTWLVLKLGKQYFKSSSPAKNEIPAFLVESLETDKLIVKLKSKKLVSTVTLVQYELTLNEYNLEKIRSAETMLQRKPAKGGSNVSSIKVRLEYAPIPSISLDQPRLFSVDSPNRNRTVVSGVVTVFIHSAQGLIFSDSGHCNSYCMLFSDRKKVLTTHCVYNSTSPQWESRCQFLVKNYSQTSLSFVVCSSWNPKKMSNDEMLGVAVFNFTEGETWVQNRQLPMCGSSCQKPPTVNVTIIFQPVDTGSRDVTEQIPTSGGEPEPKSDFGNGKTKKSYPSLMLQQAKHLLGRGDQEVQNGLSISQILTSGLGLMEISLLQAKDLVPMDKNGYSDPYCELKVNGECKYKSSVKKKTLHPIWEENTIIGMPRTGENFELIVWDRDIVGKNDFLGSLVLTPDEIRQISASDSPKWHFLKGVPSGSVEFKIRIISDDSKFSDSPWENSTKSSPMPRKNSNQERFPVRLGINVPPPVAPQTFSVPHHKNVTETLIEQVNKNLSNGVPNFVCDNSDASTHGSTSSLSRVFPIGENSPSLTRTSSRASSNARTDISVGEYNLPPPPPPHHHPTATATLPKPKKQSDWDASPFRSMKEKVSKSLRLRRFKSEVNVRQESKHCRKFKEKDDVDLLRRKSLSHAVSQPNIRNGRNSAIRPTELNVGAMCRPDKYTGVEGKVIQAQGLHVAHVAQLFCRIKLIGAQTSEKSGKSSQNNQEKTVAKSHLIPAVPNPRFELSFQIGSPETIPRQAVLLFEIRSSGKEIVAVRRITLQDLLGAEGKETHTWLALSNGATLEITIAHGRELKKQSKKLFRSWSVHRIGKV